jgi:hypothetical protein
VSRFGHDPVPKLPECQPVDPIWRIDKKIGSGIRYRQGKWLNQRTRRELRLYEEQGDQGSSGADNGGLCKHQEVFKRCALLGWFPG